MKHYLILKRNLRCNILKIKNKNNFKIILALISWVIIMIILFTGTIELEPKGHIEIAAIVSFAVLILMIHLVGIIKKYVIQQVKLKFIN